MAESIPSTVNAQPLVLLVEDYEDIRKLLEKVLQKCGFRVLGLNCGDDVLVTLCEASYALVDDSLPGNISGPQTVALLHLINPRLRIFSIPGGTFHGWELELMEAHFERCLPQPFGMAELLAALQCPVAPPPPQETPPPTKRIAKIARVMGTILNWAVVVGLFGIAAFLFSMAPDYLHDVWLEAKHFTAQSLYWLGQGSVVALAAMVLSGLLGALTVGIFAVNSDWHTRDGFTALLRWLLAEALVVAGLVGVLYLAAVALHFG